MTGRNDACPCGSGRKYKHCCLHSEQEAAESAADTGHVLDFKSRMVRRSVRDAAARAAAWQVEAVPVPVSIESERDQRPVAVLVTAEGFVLHSEMKGRLSGEPADVAAALDQAIVAAAREVGSYPATVEVRHDDVAAALRPQVLARSITVQVSETLPGLEEAARALMQHVAEVSSWPPACAVETWSAWGLPHALVGQLFGAAARFWRAAPWKIADNLQAPRVTLPSGRAWTAGVLGNAGQQFGLSLYSDADDLFRTIASDTMEAAFANVRGRVLAVTFDAIAQVPEQMPGEARRAGWELADARAFPSLVTINTPGGGVSQNDARDLVALLDAVPRFVSSHRLVLLREQRTHVPCGQLTWRDPVTGTAFEYDGLAAAQKAAEAGLEDEGEADFHAGLQEAAQEAAAELGPQAAGDELLRAINVRMRARTDAYNERPQSELGNLSPAQMQRLLAADWSDPQGAVRLRRDLRLEQLEPSTLLFNTRTLLALAEQSDGLLATQHGNLRIALVRQLLGMIRFDRAERRDLLDEKRLTEKDVWPLHCTRVLVGLAGLLKLRKGKFEITRKGRTLLRDERGGELFALLFQTCFRRLNLAYFSSFGPDWPELQHQIAFTLYALGESSPEWQSADRLLADAVLPFALEQAPETDWLDLPASLFEHRVLDVLVDFGLLERQAESSPAQRTNRYRATELFGHFLRFTLTGSPA